jgi:hypothetical protein
MSQVNDIWNFGEVNEGKKSSKLLDNTWNLASGDVEVRGHTLSKVLEELEQDK